MESQIITTNIHQSDISQENMLIESGQYYRTKTADNYPSGTLLLVSSLNIIDDILHSIELSPHPTIKPNTNNHRVLYDDFIQSYEYVPLEIALQEREAEIQEQLNLIEKARQEMMIGYVDEDGRSATQLINNINNQDRSQAQNLPMKFGGSIVEYESKANSIAELANKQKEYIISKNEMITTATTRLASFYQEKGKQALASVDGTMKYVAQLHKGIHTLSLFTGKGVTIEQISKGEGASEDEPLTFYQRKLYLDEEFFFNLHEGGADFTSVKGLSEAIKEDFSIIDRMIPSQRGVVMMQYRRKEKSYFSDEELRDNPTFSLVNAELNISNKIRFVLVRNGKNVYKLDCKDFFSAERLFPTQKEINSFYLKNNLVKMSRFGGIDFGDGKVSPNDLEYVEARDKHDAQGTFYKRLLIILSGIHTRTPQTIGEFRGSRKYNGAWYNIDFQNECCKFVHDDEEGLDFQLKPIAEYIKEKNSMMMRGSRVVAVNKSAMCDESAPKAVKYLSSGWNSGYSRSEGVYWYYTPIRRVEKHIVKIEQNEFVISVGCTPTRMSRTENNTNINVKLRFSRKNSYVVIDGIRKDELELYINSRKAREDYLNYAELLLEAKKIIEQDELENNKFLATFKEHIYLHYATFDKSKIDKAIDEAIRFYRAGKGGINLPEPTSETYNQTVAQISEILHTFLHQEEIAMGVISSFQHEYGEELVKIVIDNNGKLLLYAKKESNEFIFQSKDRVIEANVYSINKTKEKWSFKGQKTGYYDTKIDEYVLFKNERYLSATEKKEQAQCVFTNASNSGTKRYSVCETEVNQENDLVSNSSYDIYNSLKEAVVEAENLFGYIHSKKGIPLDISEKLLKTYFSNLLKSKKYYKRERVCVPLAIVGLRGQTEIDVKEDHFREVKEDKRVCKSRAMGIAYLTINDIGEFIGTFGNEESLNYLTKHLSRYRFSNVADRYKTLNRNYMSSENPLEELQKEYRVQYKRYYLDSEYQKKKHIHGIHKEELFSEVLHKINDVFGFENAQSSIIENQNLNELIESHFVVKDGRYDYKWIEKGHQIVVLNKFFKLLRDDA